MPKVKVLFEAHLAFTKLTVSIESISYSLMPLMFDCTRYLRNASIRVFDWEKEVRGLAKVGRFFMIGSKGNRLLLDLMSGTNLFLF